MTFERRVFRGAAIVLGLALLALMLWQLGHALLLVFAAILLAVFLRSLTDLVSRYTPLGAGLSLALVLLVLLGMATGLGFFLAPRLAEQAKELRTVLPQSLDRAQDYLRSLPFGDQLLDKAEDGNFMPAQAVQSHLPQVFSVTLSGLVQFAFVLIVGIYLAASPQTYIQGLLRLLPRDRRDRACEALGAMGFTLQWWLIGQIMVMVFVGAVTATGLRLLGIPMALVLGVIAGLFDFVPNIGPFVAAAPAILIALLAGPQQAVYVALLYLAVQQLEGYLLTPLVQRKTASIEPALLIGAQFFAGLLWGALGVILAAPLAAVATVAVKLLYVEDVLGDKLDVDGVDRADRVCAVDP